jgi:succinate dehydrogenase / fumarate reductase flavoprotein subunit
MDLLSHDILIVGGGLTGLRAAIEAKKAGRDVAILSKVHHPSISLRSCSGWD